MEPPSPASESSAAFPRPKRAPRWQFTLRESLLGVTAVAALLALAIKIFPSASTPFFNQFNAIAILEKEVKNLRPMPSAHSAGTSASSSDRRRHWEYSSNLGQRPLGELGYAFAQRVESELERHGCTITGRSTSGNPSRKHITGFGYSYYRGSTRGELFAELIDLGAGNFTVHVFCYEFNKR